MVIIDEIKRYLAKNKLKSWHDNWATPSKQRIKEVANGSTRIYTPEFETFIDNACIRRYYQANKVCVDLYWHIKPSRKDGHVLSIHYRKDWRKVVSTINRVEEHELPRAMYDAFKKVNNA